MKVVYENSIGVSNRDYVVFYVITVFSLFVSIREMATAAAFSAISYFVYDNSLPMCLT